jgi:hypothetical protein
VKNRHIELCASAVAAAASVALTACMQSAERQTAQAHSDSWVIVPAAHSADALIALQLRYARQESTIAAQQLKKAGVMLATVPNSPLR